eukprot:TRINITY_DN314_c0_g1_i1.p1 TRINITY_DN314_c0_g1~~TRINITY_DN314_c0_g1_i1.p1  ORF type:complete len:1082 (+),score=278.71 TRINITY_DN314_c0_g1_i1:73-3318(+)
MSSEEQFIQLLSALRSSDNELRASAEKTYKQTLLANPDAIMQALLQIARTHSDVHLKVFCIAQLKRALHFIVKKKTLLLQLSPSVSEVIKTEVIAGIEYEDVTYVRSLLCSLASDMAIVYFSRNLTWNELVNWCLEKIGSDNDVVKISAFSIIHEIGGYFVDFPFVMNNVNRFFELLLLGIGSANLQVAVEAMKSATTIVQFFKDYRRDLSVLIEPMLQVILKAMRENNEDSCSLAIQQFINIAGFDPGFLIPKLDSVTGAMIELANSENVPEEITKVASEFLISIVENKRKLCAANPEFIDSCVQVFLKMMLSIKDFSLEEWNTKIDLDMPEVSCAVHAGENLDRLSIALPGELVLETVWKYIEQFLAKDDWKYQYAALTTLSQIAEGSKEIMSGGSDDITNMLLGLSGTEDPRIQFAIITTIGQLSTDLGPLFQKRYHSEVLPLIMKYMTSNFSKVRNHAVECLHNFCGKFSPVLLEEYLPTLLPTLFQFLQSGDVKLQKVTLSTLIIVSWCAEKGFVPYYDIFMPYLIQLFESNVSGVKGRAMEAMANIAASCGKEKFLPDSNRVLTMLKNEQDKIEDPVESKEYSYYEKSWSRFAACLGTDFGPYLQYLIGDLVEGAAIEAESEIITNGDLNDEYDYFKIDEGETIGIHTSSLEDKAECCRLLNNYCLELGSTFYPYVETVSSIMVPLLSYPFHQGVSSSAYSIMPSLLNCVSSYLKENNIASREPIQQLFSFIYPAMIESIAEEQDIDIMIIAIEGLSKSIRAAGVDSLNEDQIRHLLGQFKNYVDFMVANREELLENQEEDPSIFIEEYLQLDGVLITNLADLMNVLLELNTDRFLKVFGETEMMGYLVSLLDRNASESEIQLGICIMDDLIEFGKEKTLSLLSTIVPNVIGFIDHEYSGIVQAVVYGLGIFGSVTSDEIAPYLEQIISSLCKFIQNTPRSSVYVYAIENAISSLGKIIKAQAGNLGNQLPSLVDIWLPFLPLEVDDIEGMEIHDVLCDMIELPNTYIFGENYKHLPHILNIFSIILFTEFVTESTENRIKSILHTMSTQLPEMFQQALSTLSDNQKRTITKCFN